MSKDWVEDIARMHEVFGATEWTKNKIAEGDIETLKKFLEFRMNFLAEELVETGNAVGMRLQETENGTRFVRYSDTTDPEEIVDGLIDLCVVAIGTLDIFGIDAHRAWDEVLRANMSKKAGVKPGRPNLLGLPDMIKPTKATHGYDWEAPSHAGNHGIFG